MKKITKKAYSLIISKEFLLFLLGGGSAFIVDFSILKFQTDILNFKYELFGFIFVPNVISTSISILYSFIFQKLISFKERDGNISKQFVKHLSLHSVNLIVFNTILFGILLDLKITVGITKVIVTFVQMFWSFTAYKFFVFKKTNNVAVN